MSKKREKIGKKIKPKNLSFWHLSRNMRRRRRIPIPGDFG
jgi:hypothetical protein